MKDNTPGLGDVRAAIHQLNKFVGGEPANRWKRLQRLTEALIHLGRASGLDYYEAGPAASAVKAAIFEEAGSMRANGIVSDTTEAVDRCREALRWLREEK